MNWDRIEDNWAHRTGNVNERWGDLPDHQLADKVQDIFGLTNGEDDAQGQLTDWQQRLADIERGSR